MFNDYRHVSLKAATDDARLRGFNPHARNRPPRTCDVMKKKFAELRSKYTTAMSRFKQSGQQNGDPDKAREEFWNDYAAGDLTLLYMYIAWHETGSVEMEVIARSLPRNAGLEEGCWIGPRSGRDSQDHIAPTAATTASDSSLSNSARRRRNNRGAESIAQAFRETSTPPEHKRARLALDTSEQVAHYSTEDAFQAEVPRNALGSSSGREK